MQDVGGQAAQKQMELLGGRVTSYQEDGADEPRPGEQTEAGSCSSQP